MKGSPVEVLAYDQLYLDTANSGNPFTRNFCDICILYIS